MKISENIKNGPKNLKNVSTENLGKNKELPALGKSQRLKRDFHFQKVLPVHTTLQIIRKGQVFKLFHISYQNY